MSDCVFCDLVAGVYPVSIAYEDDVVLAFMDTSPVNPGHTLVIPKKHFTWSAEATPPRTPTSRRPCQQPPADRWNLIRTSARHLVRPPLLYFPAVPGVLVFELYL